MHQLLPTKSHQEKMQKSEDEHSFSDELNGNWIKILNLNKIRKEKEMQRKQHPKDVKKQRDKTTTENEEELGGKEALKVKNRPKSRIKASNLKNQKKKSK